MLKEILELSTTVETQPQAQLLARTLVEGRLAACVQIEGPLHSVYFWQGELCQASEFGLTVKSLVELESKLIDFIHQHHPYECPQIIVGRVRASPAYAEWIQAQVDA